MGPTLEHANLRSFHIGLNSQTYDMETFNKHGLVRRIGMPVRSERENEENYTTVRNKSRSVPPLAQKKGSRRREQLCGSWRGKQQDESQPRAWPAKQREWVEGKQRARVVCSNSMSSPGGLSPELLWSRYGEQN